MSIIKNFLNSRKGNPNGEMGFLDHIEELRWNIVRALIAVFVSSALVFFNIKWIFANVLLPPAHHDFVTYRWLCQLGHALHTDVLCLSEVDLNWQNRKLAGQFMMSFSVSFMLGLILAFPYIFWELWKFISPALKQSEVRHAKGVVFWCSVLFFLGVLFAYYLIAPFTINFFANYKLNPSVQNIFDIEDYYSTMSDLIFGLGIVFELPVVVYFLSRVGILTPKFLRTYRRHAIVVLLMTAFVIGPPDLFSSLLVFIPLYALYEVSVAMSGRVYKERLKQKLKNENE